MIPMEKLREQGRKPVRITAKGEVFIGGDEFPYPIAADSISVARCGRRLNVLTVSLYVGEVTMEVKPPNGIPEDEDLRNRDREATRRIFEIEECLSRGGHFWSTDVPVGGNNRCTQCPAIGALNVPPINECNEPAVPGYMKPRWWNIKAWCSIRSMQRGLRRTR